MTQPLSPTSTTMSATPQPSAARPASTRPFIQGSPPPAYSPLLFLAALGAGGLTVTFFLMLMFWIPHPDQPVPVFEDVRRAFAGGDLWQQAVITIALAGIAFFSATLTRLLVWNVRQLRHMMRSNAGLTGSSGAQTRIAQLAIPLTLAMTINTAFIVGLVFVPGLWNVVEFLFPAAMLAFVLIGIYALRLFARFASLVLKEGLSDGGSNSLAAMMPAFAFSMIGVGLAAPAAMSSQPITAAISLGLSTLFLAAAVVQGLLAFVIGIRAIVERGLATEGAPTLMIGVPILTVITIALLRQDHGLHTHFAMHTDAASTFMLLLGVVVMQALILLAGWGAMRTTSYLERFVFGADRSPGTLALLCPLVAFSVSLHFFINKGLVGLDLITKFSPAFWTASALPLIVQGLAIWLFFKLTKRLIGRAPTTPASTPLAA